MKWSFQDMLGAYYAKTPFWPKTYCGQKLLAIFLFVKGRGYKTRRDRILMNLQKKRSHRTWVEMFRREMLRPNPLFEMLAKDDPWQGSYLLKPVRFGETLSTMEEIRDGS